MRILVVKKGRFDVGTFFYHHRRRQHRFRGIGMTGRSACLFRVTAIGNSSPGFGLRVFRAAGLANCALTFRFESYYLAFSHAAKAHPFCPGRS